MTLHVSFTHECGECGAYYIPYDADVPCPNCGKVEAERFDFIPQAVASMEVNKEEGGCYTTGAWFVGGLGDHLLLLLFGLFDSYEEQEGKQSFSDFVDGYLGNIEWGEQDYLGPHFQGIAMRIHEEMQKEARSGK